MNRRPPYYSPLPGPGGSRPLPFQQHHPSPSREQQQSQQGFYPTQHQQGQRYHPADAAPPPPQPQHQGRPSQQSIPPGIAIHPSSNPDTYPPRELYGGAYQELPYGYGGHVSTEMPLQPTSSSSSRHTYVGNRGSGGMQGGSQQQQKQGGGEQPQRVGRKRGRVPTSCTECRARKQRCDRAQPCLQCSKRQVDPSICQYEIDPSARTVSSRTTATSEEAGGLDGVGDGPSGNGGGGEKRRDKRRKSVARRDDPSMEGQQSAVYGFWNPPPPAPVPGAFAGGRFDDGRARGDDGLTRYTTMERTKPPTLDTMLNDLSAYRMVGSSGAGAARRPWDDPRSGTSAYSFPGQGTSSLDLTFSLSSRASRHHYNNYSDLPPVIPPSPVLRPWSAEADIRGEDDYEQGTKASCRKGKRKESAPKSSSSEGDTSPVARRARDLPPPRIQDKNQTTRNAFQQNGFLISDAAEVILGPATRATRPKSDFDKAQSWSPENIKSRCLSKLPAKERCDELVQRYFDRFNSLALVHQEEFKVLYDTVWYPPPPPGPSSHESPATPPKTVDTPFLSLLLIVVAFGCVPLPHRTHQPNTGIVTIDDAEPLVLPPIKFIRQTHTYMAPRAGEAGDRHASQVSMADGDMVLARRLYHASYQVFHLEASQETLDSIRAGTLLVKFASLLGYRLEACSLVSYIAASGGKHQQIDESSGGGGETTTLGSMSAMAMGIPAVIQPSDCTVQRPVLDLGTDSSSSPDFKSAQERNNDSILSLHCGLYDLVSRLREQNSTVELAEAALQRFKQGLPEGYFVYADDETIEHPTRIFVSTSFHYVRTTLHRGSLMLSVDPADGVGEEEVALRERSRQAALESALEEVRLRLKLGYSHDLHMMTSVAGINTAAIIAMAVYQKVPHPSMSSSEVLDILRTYLEYEAGRSFLSEVSQDQLEVAFDLTDGAARNVAAMDVVSTRDVPEEETRPGLHRVDTESGDTLQSQRSPQTSHSQSRYQHSSHKLPMSTFSSDLSMLINPMESASHQTPVSYTPSQHYRHDLSGVSDLGVIRSPVPGWTSQQAMSASSSSSTPGVLRGGRTTHKAINRGLCILRLRGIHPCLQRAPGRDTVGPRGLQKTRLLMYQSGIVEERRGWRRLGRGKRKSKSTSRERREG
ncbi:hypothetical protein IAR50_004405 [Cryptococcus sp. DSM 104548]